MSGPGGKRPRKGGQGNVVPISGRRGSKRGKKSPNGDDTTEQDPACICGRCGRVCKSPGGRASHERHCDGPPAADVAPVEAGVSLAEHESTAAALERVLKTMRFTLSRAPLVAQLRQLAVAVDDPVQSVRASAEFSARYAELLAAEVGRAGDEPDWTEGSDPAEVGNPA